VRFDLPIPLRGRYKRELKMPIRTKACTQRFRAEFITNNGKGAKCPSNNEWISKCGNPCGEMCCSHEKGSTNTCYNMNKPWKHAKEERQTQKAHIVRSHVYAIFRIGKVIGEESRIVAGRHGR
jgi:hypothetical protein